MRKSFAFIAVGSVIIMGSIVGCSKKPSAEELQQLNDLKTEVSSLENAIKARESEKAALSKSIAEKDAELAQCASDKAALQEAIQKTQKSGKK